MPISSCNSSDGSLSLAAILPSHGVNLQFLLAGINTIGGIRLALEGSGTQQENYILQASYTLVDITFAQAFSASGLLLTQQPSFTFQLTKMINRTYPLTEDGQTQLSGIWMPYVSTDINDIFVNENEYIYAKSSNTILSLVIIETPYYVLNTQQPIVDEAELIFTNILFTILCMEYWKKTTMKSNLISMIPNSFGISDQEENSCTGGLRVVSKQSNELCSVAFDKLMVRVKSVLRLNSFMDASLAGVRNET
ncbi:unnamed protein product [Rotaria socialis]|uniref:Uncharacterized protein n=1 Tax=Rotaria socialis TaxID=392032 RepID=A0A818HDT8_9BILA|nr:unnamed protein product [Rotaria socialis]